MLYSRHNLVNILCDLFIHLLGHELIFMKTSPYVKFASYYWEVVVRMADD